MSIGQLTKADLKQFIELPYRLRKDDPQWVPPLRFERREFLDRNKNPWFEHAECELMLAERDGRVVGRITAHIDHRWDEYQGGNDGMFGFFDAEDDPEVFQALIDAASGWLRERGRERMLGPMDFTMNDECGILIEGFDEPSMILEPWHPPYYSQRLEAARARQGDRPADVGAVARQAQGGQRVSPADPRRGGEVAGGGRRRCGRCESATWRPRSGASWRSTTRPGATTGASSRSPRPRSEFQAKNLKPVLDENWAMMAEKDGEVVGAALTLPDVEQALAKMDGRLLPFKWIHFLRRKRYIDRLRVFALGVKHDYQHLGVAAALYERHVRDGGHGWARRAATWAGSSRPTTPMNRAMEGMGGRVVQRYRIYERAGRTCRMRA